MNVKAGSGCVDVRLVTGESDTRRVHGMLGSSDLDEI